MNNDVPSLSPIITPDDLRAAVKRQALEEMGMDSADYQDYVVVVRVFDRFQKPAGLQHTKTSQRVNWDERLVIENVTSPKQAKQIAIWTAQNTWVPTKYRFKIVSCMPRLEQKSKLILPKNPRG